MAKPALRAAHYGWLALAVFALTIYGSLIPFHFKPQSLDEAFATFRKITFSAPGDVGARGDWNISIALFTTLSFVFMGMFCVDRPRADTLRAAPLVAIFCAFLSLLIEFVQVYFPPRTVSVNDLIVQAAGGCLGTVAWLGGGQRITKWVRRLGSAMGVAGLARRLWPGYLVLLVIVQLMPFDFTVSFAELAAKYDNHGIALVPFANLLSKGVPELIGKVFIHGLCFAPLGFLRVLALDQAARARKPWLAVFTFGLAVSSLVEGLQLFVFTRVCDTTDIITGTAAVALGWYAGGIFCDYWGKFLQKPNMRLTPDWHPMVWTALTLTWLATILYFHWTPFDFTTDPARFTADSEDLTQYGLRRFSWLPLVDYYWGNKYNALDQFIKKTLSFMPLGFLIALGRRKLYQSGTTWLVISVALTAALLVETGRYFLPARGPSSTDLLISCFGAWLGFMLTQHIRVVFWAERTLFGFAHRVHPEAVPTKS